MKELLLLQQQIDRYLDNALTRPGRFDRIINVGLPDLDGRKNNRHSFNNKPLSEETKEYLDDVAKLTSGFSGADIANLANGSPF